LRFAICDLPDECTWLDGATGPEVGARFKARKKVPNRPAWHNKPVVTVADPGREFASGATSGFPMSFEIDGIDEIFHTGWSVVVNGVGHEVVDGTELARLRALELRPWASGPKTHWIRIQPKTMTGRRVARND
jgi:Pyridoxamine 5'-phosphate oxidase